MAGGAALTNVDTLTKLFYYGESTSSQVIPPTPRILAPGFCPTFLMGTRKPRSRFPYYQPPAYLTHRPREPARFSPKSDEGTPIAPSIQVPVPDVEPDVAPSCPI